VKNEDEVLQVVMPCSIIVGYPLHSTTTQRPWL